MPAGNLRRKPLRSWSGIAALPPRRRGGEPPEAGTCVASSAPNDHAAHRPGGGHDRFAR